MLKKGKYNIIYLVMVVLKKAKKVLNELNRNGYEAYIVGGFVRDYLLKRKSYDIDICTNAKPKEIKEIFKEACIPDSDYGSVIVVIANVRFEITTYRKEISYINNRKPEEIEYIDNLKEDVVRRDFTINSICMDKNEKIIDLLNGKEDLKNKKIRTIGDSYIKFEQDSLRILRAIRFATILDFDLTNDTEYAIKRTKHLIKKLSYERKKQELDKIFSSSNIEKGIELLKKFGLEEELEIDLSKLEHLGNCNDLLGVWALLDVGDLYPFTSNEKDLIMDIRNLLNEGRIDNKSLYKYDLYPNIVVASILGQDKRKVTKMYNTLPIKSRKDIAVDANTIVSVLNKEPGAYLKEIFEDLEDKILTKKIKNKKAVLLKYIVKNYNK